MITDKDEHEINMDNFEREDLNLISLHETNSFKKPRSTNTIQSQINLTEYEVDEDLSSTTSASQSNRSELTAPAQSSPSLTPAQSPTDIPLVTPAQLPSDVPTTNCPLPATTTIHDTEYHLTKREMEILFEKYLHSKHKSFKKFKDSNIMCFYLYR